MALHLDQITGPLPSNRVGDVIYERILDAIHYGELRPGERLSDQEIARQLGVSRTPVRETLLRLQVMGVVEIAAARYTRVAMVSRKQTVEAVRVWASPLPARGQRGLSLRVHRAPGADGGGRRDLSGAGRPAWWERAGADRRFRHCQCRLLLGTGRSVGQHVAQARQWRPL